MLASSWKKLEACLGRFDHLLQDEDQSIATADIAALEAGHHRKQQCLSEIKDELHHLRQNKTLNSSGKIGEWPAELQEKYYKIIQRLQENLRRAEQQRDTLRTALDQFNRQPDRVLDYPSRRQKAETIPLVDVKL